MISSVPIYDYRCDHCGHVFSAVQSFSDNALETCPNCGKKPRRLILAPAVVFKGSGWYKTDSRGAAPKEGDAPAAKTDDAKKDTKDTKDTKATKDTKKETKPDAAAPPSSAPAKSEGSS
jgi:putative FmdB family regulatory protein